MFYSKDAVEHKGESILWANRQLWPEKNMTATILKTLTVNSLFAALQRKSKNPGKATKPKTSPYKPRTLHEVEIGGGFETIPVNDIKRATYLFYQVLEADMQRGSLSAIDYGTLTFPLSNVAITQLTSSRNDIFLPRVNTKAVFMQALSRMIINQCIALGKPIIVGRKGSENQYSPSDLEGDYTIEYQFFTESAEQRIANLTIAKSASQFLSSDTVRRDYLNLKDPDGEDIKKKSEEAEMVDEVLFLYRRARKLLDPVKAGEKTSLQNKIEAYLLGQRIKTIIKQRITMGQLSLLETSGFPKVQAEAQGKPEAPLLTEGGGGAAGIGNAARRPSMLTRGPAEEEAIEEAEYE